jgi:hypothetical protein
MRRYADPVEVRQGYVDGEGAEAGVEGPEQFLWRGRLWKVRAVVAHWVETGPWWQFTGVRTVIGSDEVAAEEVEDGPAPQRPLLGDLLTERELWRVEAGRGRPRLEDRPEEQQPDHEAGISGVFDLAFDWAEGRWTLVGCTD